MIFEHCFLKTYSKDSLVYDFDEKTEFLYIIKQGEIEVNRKKYINKEFLFYIFKISEEIQLYNKAEYLEEIDVSSIEEVKKQTESLRKAEYNTFNKSFQGKQEKKMKKIMPVNCIFFYLLFLINIKKKKFN